MDRSGEVVARGRSQVDRSCYVWGAKGQDICAKSDPEAWVQSMETENGGYTREQNVQRVMIRFEKLRRTGQKEILCFDCSGFIFWLFSYFGLIKTRTNAEGLFRQCTEKQRGELRAGDLVFVHSGQKITHVGIFAGDGQVMHSKGRDVGVVLEKLSAHAWNRYGRWPSMYDDDSKPEPGQAMVKTKGTVHIRSGPGSQYKRLGTSKDGDTFPLIETKDGWHQIVYQDGTAWVSGKKKYTEVIA